jgi:hypothetical protein
MPSALDRLLTSPSALRLLRAAINTPESPTAYLGTTATKCCTCRTHPRRAYQQPRPSTTPPLNWNRFNQGPAAPEARDVQLQDGQKPHDARTWAECLQQKARIGGWIGIRQVDDSRLQGRSLHQRRLQHVHDGPSRSRTSPQLTSGNIEPRMSHVNGTNTMQGHKTWFGKN